MKASIKITGTKEFTKLLKNIEALDLTDVGEIVKQRMIDIIDENRKRDVKQPEERNPENPYYKHISDVLDVEVKSNGIGIGNVNKLNAEVPYWRLVNDGGMIKGMPRGIFLGDSDSSSFMFNKKGPRMVPQKPIEGMHFIEKTGEWVNKNLKKFIDNKIVKEFKDNRSKSAIRIM